MATKVNEMLSSIIGEMKQIAKTETIIGEAVILGEKKVVPVSRVMIGFAIGGGEGESTKKLGGFGGAGGGGVRVDPIGFIVIEDKNVSFLPVKSSKLEGLIEAVPAFIDKFKSDKKGDEEK